jgi:hypothetical protein
MWVPIRYQILCLQLLSFGTTAAFKKPQYHQLPPLREQAVVENAWRQERIENIPNILRKHGVDAWLVCHPICSSSAAEIGEIDESKRTR